MELRVDTLEGRNELWRQWAGKVPVEASELIPALFDLIDERDEQIRSLRRERDTLVEAYLHGRSGKAAL